MVCPHCKIAARVARVEERPDATVTRWMCVNLRCPNNRKIIEETVKAPKKGK